MKVLFDKTPIGTKHPQVHIVHLSSAREKPEGSSRVTNCSVHHHNLIDSIYQEIKVKCLHEPHITTAKNNFRSSYCIISGFSCRILGKKTSSSSITRVYFKVWKIYPAGRY